MTNLPTQDITWQKQTNKQTRRANAQIIHIHHTHKTSLQSSPLHNQPSQTSELLHVILQQNNFTGSSLRVTL